jgi:hypothetical protein
LAHRLRGAVDGLAYLEAASLGTPLPSSMFWPIHDTMAKLGKALMTTTR